MTVKVTFTIRDEKGKRGRTSLFAEDAILTDPNFTLEQIIASRVDQIDALVEGVIEKVSVSFDVDLSLATTRKLSPNTGADIEEKGFFRWDVLNAPGVDMSIPTFDHSLFPEGTTRITDPTIDDNLLHFTDGIVDPLGSLNEGFSWTDNRGAPINGFRYLDKKFEPVGD